MDYYRIRPELARKLANPFLEAPADAVDTKKGGKKWQETLVVQDVEFWKDEDDESHERLQIQFQIPSDVETVNQGRMVSAFMHFYWTAVEEGKPENRAMQTQISYREFCALLGALGETEYKSPGEIRTVDYQGMRVVADVVVEKDKEGRDRQNVGGYKAV